MIKENALTVKTISTNIFRHKNNEFEKWRACVGGVLA